MNIKTMTWIAAIGLAMTTACGDDSGSETTEPTNVSTNNATTNNASANNSANEKFRFTFENESGDQMLEDFAGATAIGVNTQNPNFSINLGNNSGASIAMTVVKEQGPLMATTYQTDLFQYAFDGTTCIRSSDQEVTLTFTEVDPPKADVVGSIKCGAATPEEFTADITGSFEL